jgi:hypothetical protein
MGERHSLILRNETSMRGLTSPTAKSVDTFSVDTPEIGTVWPIPPGNELGDGYSISIVTLASFEATPLFAITL